MGIVQGAKVYLLRDWPGGKLKKGDSGIVQAVSAEGIFNEPLVLVELFQSKADADAAMARFVFDKADAGFIITAIDDSVMLFNGPVILHTYVESLPEPLILVGEEV